MDPILFPIGIGIVALIITLADKIPRSVRKTILGAMIIILVVDSVVAAVSAFLR